ILQERPEFEAWGLKGNTVDAAEVIVEIRLPFLTWEWNYRMIQRTSGLLLGSGKVKALEEHQAAPLLAGEIVETIAAARGTPAMRAGVNPSSPRAQTWIKRWNVKGATGPFQDKQLILSIGRGSISVNEQSGQSIEIPSQSLLSAYHVVSDGSDLRRQRAWDSGWDKACEKTMGGEGCLAILGAPIWLIGDAILMIPGTSTHFLVIRWHDDQSINEMSFRVGALEWKNMLRDLRA